MAESEQIDLTALTVELLSAFVSNTRIESSDLAGLIRSTHTALAAINTPAPDAAPVPEFEPAVTVRKSLGSQDHIISLIDGKPYKTLKRHLASHGLTPAEYRERYKLAADYPMVAVSYSEHRRDTARRLGLGRKPPVNVSGAEAAAIADKPEGVKREPSVTTTAKAANKSGRGAATAKAAPDKPATVSTKRATQRAKSVLIEMSGPDTDATTAAPVPPVARKTAKKPGPRKPAEATLEDTIPASEGIVPKTGRAKRGRPKAVAQ